MYFIKDFENSLHLNIGEFNFYRLFDIFNPRNVYNYLRSMIYVY